MFSIAIAEFEFECILICRVCDGHFVTLGNHVGQFPLEVRSSLLLQAGRCGVVERGATVTDRRVLQLAACLLVSISIIAVMRSATHASGSSLRLSIKSCSVQLRRTVSGLARNPQTGQSSFFWCWNV